jgi:uncharacterized protein (DUF1499 family)
VIVLLAGRMGLLLGSEPSRLGVTDGKLKPPSRTPNSVSSQADLWPDHAQAADARIDPLPLMPGPGTTAERGAATLARLKTLIAGLPGAEVVQSDADYLRAHFTTPILRFRDDVELWFDPAAGVVHVRSASRVGRKDFGVNRQRVENLRRLLASAAV